jgi:hypothetical protein
MKYCELTDNPFCIPYGKKVQITMADGSVIACHFGGYRTTTSRVVDRAQLIPQFHEITTSGSMSRNVHVVTYTQGRDIQDITPIKELFEN